MRVLVTNDDGISSHALAPLVDLARRVGDEVMLAAPTREYSGAGASLLGTGADGRLLLEERGRLDGVRTLAVQASPAMIVFSASYGAFGPVPDLVLSGVNLGANTGRATLHSGTVGAALTAASLGIPAMAVSVASARPRHLDVAHLVADRALGWLLAQDRSYISDKVLNVNVPDLPLPEVRGMRQARLASFGAVAARVEEHGTGYVTLTYSGLGSGDELGTDAYLLARGWATLTLLDGVSSVPEAPLPRWDAPAARDWREHSGDAGDRPDAPATGLRGAVGTGRVTSG